MSFPPSLTIDPEETIARRIILDLVGGDNAPDLEVVFTDLDLKSYDSIKMNIRHEDLGALSRTVTPDATEGYVMDGSPWPLSDQDGKTVQVSVDGGATQTITFSGVTTSISDAAAQLGGLSGCHVTEDGMFITITSASYGEGSSIEIIGGTSDIAWETPVDGTGDLDAGTVAWSAGDLVEGRHTAEFEFTLGSAVFTLPRRFPVELAVRRAVG